MTEVRGLLRQPLAEAGLELVLPWRNASAARQAMYAATSSASTRRAASQ